MKKSISIVPRWFPALGMMLVIYAFSSQTGDDLPDFLGWDYVIKKMGHGIGFGLLALSYFRLLKSDGKRYPLAWLLALLYAVTDEFHQTHVIGRHASIIDVLLFDNFGAAIALWSHFTYWRKHGS